MSAPTSTPRASPPPRRSCPHLGGAETLHRFGIPEERGSRARGPTGRNDARSVWSEGILFSRVWWRYSRPSTLRNVNVPASGQTMTPVPWLPPPHRLHWRPSLVLVRCGRGVRPSGPGRDCDVLLCVGHIVDGAGAPGMSWVICVAGNPHRRNGDAGRPDRQPARDTNRSSSWRLDSIDLLGHSGVSDLQKKLDTAPAQQDPQGVTDEITGEGSLGSARTTTPDATSRKAY